MLRRKQDLLDRYHAVQDLIVAAPDPAHAALADWLGQQVPPANQSPRPTWHGTMIEEKPAGNADERTYQPKVS
jgi:hypothetical protein